jgi:pSer/pThr/pTyr-binding forkhead associated (FHA) protein
MDVSLVLLDKGGAQKTFPLKGEVTTIGRRHGCDLMIPLPVVSRKHCQLSRANASLEIHDLGSTWGTFVNGKRLDGQSALKAGDVIRIGPVTLVCRIDGKPEKIVLPKKTRKKVAAKAAEKPQPAGGDLDDSFADLDASDSFMDLDASDTDLADL